MQNLYFKSEDKIEGLNQFKANTGCPWENGNEILEHHLDLIGWKLRFDKWWVKKRLTSKKCSMVRKCNHSVPAVTIRY